MALAADRLGGAPQDARRCQRDEHEDVNRERAHRAVEGARAPTPSKAPPAAVTVAMMDDAVPATCGNGSIASELLFGDSPCTSGSTTHSANVNSQKLGCPSPVKETATSPIAATTPMIAWRARAG